MTELYQEAPLSGFSRAVEKYLSGEGCLSDFFEALEQARLELTELKNGFYDTVGLLGESPGEKLKDSIHEADGIFLSVFELFERLESSGASVEPEELSSGSAEFEELMASLNRAFLAFRDRAVAAAGPYAHGGLNLLYRLCSAEDGAPQEEIAAQIRLERAVTAELNDFFAGEPDVLFCRALQEFYLRYRDFLDRFFPADGEMELGEAMTAELELLGRSYAYVDLHCLTERFGREPTEVPGANLVLNISKARLEGLVHEEVALHVIDNFLTVLQQVVLAFQQWESAELSPEIEAEAEALLSQRLPSLEEYALQLREAVSSGAGEAAPALCEAFEEAARDCSMLFRRLDRDSSDVSELISCPFCGASNSLSEARCRHCRSALPSSGGDSLLTQRSGNSPTSNVREIFEAADAFAAGGDPDVFLAVLERHMQQAARLAEDAEKESPDGGRQEILNRYKKGIEDFYGALGLFRDYACGGGLLELAQAKELMLAAMTDLENLKETLGEGNSGGL